MKRISIFFKTAIVITALMAIGVTGPALGQTPAQTGLKGIANLSLLVEKLSEDGVRCELSQESIKESVEESLANSAIKLSDGNYPTLYVQVNTAAASELCYSSVTMNIHYYAKVPHPVNTQGTVAQILLWSDSYLVSSEKSAHAAYVRDQINSSVEFLVTDWKKQNSANSAATAPARGTVASPAQ